MPRHPRARPAGIVGAVALAVGLAACSSSSSGAGGDALTAGTATPGPIHSMMIVGDSITTGASGDVTWRCRLWQHLQSDGVKINFVGPYDDLYDPPTRQSGSHQYATKDCDYDHGAIWGRTADQERDSIHADVAKYRPDVLVVMLGTDDLVYISDAQTAEDKMSDIITEARGGQPNIRIVLSEIPPKDTTGIPGLSAQMNAYNAGLVDLARTMTTPASPIAIADPNPGYNPKKDNYDGTHPNPVGEYKIAAAVADTLSSAFHLGKPFGPIPKVSPNPPPPAKVLAAPRPAGAILLWTNAPGATAYSIHYRVGTEGTWVLLPGIFPKRTFTASSLTPGTTYQFEISTIRWNDESTPSAPVTVTAG